MLAWDKNLVSKMEVDVMSSENETDDYAIIALLFVLHMPINAALTNYLVYGPQSKVTHESGRVLNKADMTSIKTPVTVLQEHLLKRNQVASYNLIYNGVGTHEPMFKFEVSAGKHTAVGTGKSKKEAKHEAARIVLQKLKSSGEDFTDLVEDTQTITSPYAEVLKDNAVGALTDFCAQHFLPVPKYELTRDEGLPHAKVFCMRCSVSSLSEESTARTKKQAKQLAAHAMLDTLAKCLAGVLTSIPNSCNNTSHNNHTFEESCQVAIQKMDDTGVKKVGFAIPLGLPIDNFQKVFKEETFPKSESLEEIKGRPFNWFECVGDPEAMLKKMLSELDIGIETGNLHSFDPLGQ
ncbi:hypothetical protein AAG570_000722 [Ranatra chinensis]|uniref:DRBM domain-containing protein n=1 Tax=Ranatra chinensis TaxID=642074 RepID=A0ABD0YZY7_9HEMI